MRRRASNPFTAISEDARWLASYLSNLSQRQRRALDDVEQALALMEHRDGKDHGELKDDELFLVAYQDYVKAMIHAIRVGLADHPVVQDFIETRRNIGAWKTLRRARSGAEKGVRAMGAEDVYLRHDIVRHVEEYEQKHGKPLTQKRARSFLRADQKISKMSPQAFYKLLKRLKLLHYFPRRY